jgi:hypothetical protein
MDSQAAMGTRMTSTHCSYWRRNTKAKKAAKVAHAVSRGVAAVLLFILADLDSWSFRVYISPRNAAVASPVKSTRPALLAVKPDCPAFSKLYSERTSRPKKSASCGEQHLQAQAIKTQMLRTAMRLAPCVLIPIEP